MYYTIKTNKALVSIRNGYRINVDGEPSAYFTLIMPKHDGRFKTIYGTNIYANPSYIRCTKQVKILIYKGAYYLFNQDDKFAFEGNDEDLLIMSHKNGVDTRLNNNEIQLQRE